MAQITIFREDQGINANINVNVRNDYTVNSEGFGTKRRFYLEITTTLRKLDNSTFPAYYLYDLSDVPPGEMNAASDYTNLINMWLDYLVTEAKEPIVGE